MLGEAANEGGWAIDHLSQHRNTTRIVFTRGRDSIYVRYTRWRHTRSRVYRGNALAAILAGQSAVADALAT